MTLLKPEIDANTLLCERCGYVIQGLPAGGNCPECGYEIASSMPHKRIGTPWQIKPSPGSLLKTWWMTLRSPGATLDRIAPDAGRDRGLAWLSCCIAGFVGTLGYTGWSIGNALIYPHGNPKYWMEPQPSQRLELLLFTLILSVAACLVLVGLTRVESMGLRVIALTRGFRMPASLRRTITAHGCIGWVVGCALFGIASFLMTVWYQYAILPAAVSDADGFPMLLWETPLWFSVVSNVTPLLGLFAGFMVFEIFAYLGLRRCKYANLPVTVPADITRASSEGDLEPSP